MKSLLFASAAVLTMLPMTAAARGRVAIFAGPAFVPYGPGLAYGWYGYPFGPYFAVPNAGEVKLDTKVKDAEVFINGNYAGTVGKLKTMTMQAGNYSIDIRAPGRTAFREDIHVVAGKTLKIRPDIRIENAPGRTTS